MWNGITGIKISFIDRVYGTEQINQQIKEYCEVNNIGFRPFNDNRIILNGESVYVKNKLLIVRYVIYRIMGRLMWIH
jgi:hypothetical protein